MPKSHSTLRLPDNPEALGRQSTATSLPAPGTGLPPGRGSRRRETHPHGTQLQTPPTDHTRFMLPWHLRLQILPPDPYPKAGTHSAPQNTPETPQNPTCWLEEGSSRRDAEERVAQQPPSCQNCQLQDKHHLEEPDTPPPQPPWPTTAGLNPKLKPGEGALGCTCASPQPSFPLPGWARELCSSLWLSLIKLQMQPGPHSSSSLCRTL